MQFYRSLFEGGGHFYPWQVPTKRRFFLLINFEPNPKILDLQWADDRKLRGKYDIVDHQIDHFPFNI